MTTIQNNEWGSPWSDVIGNAQKLYQGATQDQLTAALTQLMNQNPMAYAGMNYENQLAGIAPYMQSTYGISPTGTYGGDLAGLNVYGGATKANQNDATNAAILQQEHQSSGGLFGGDLGTLLAVGGVLLGGAGALGLLGDAGTGAALGTEAAANAAGGDVLGNLIASNAANWGIDASGLVGTAGAAAGAASSGGSNLLSDIGNSLSNFGSSVSNGISNLFGGSPATTGATNMAGTFTDPTTGLIYNADGSLAVGNSGAATAIDSLASGGGGMMSALSSLLGSNPLMTGAQLLSGILGSNAATSAANTQAGAANNATAAQLSMFNTLNGQSAPYRSAGYAALSPMLAGIGMGPAAGGVDRGQFTHQFNNTDLNSYLAPNYTFQLNQGLGAVANQANGQGGLGGNELKAINDYAQNYAGNAYQNAFNNYNTNQSNIFNRLASVAGLGQTANGQSVQSGTTLGTGAANTMTQAGNAAASGIVGSNNAITSGLNNAASWYSMPSLSNIMNMGA